MRTDWWFVGNGKENGNCEKYFGCRVVCEWEKMDITVLLFVLTSLLLSFAGGGQGLDKDIETPTSCTVMKQKAPTTTFV